MRTNWFTMLVLTVICYLLLLCILIAVGINIFESVRIHIVFFLLAILPALGIFYIYLAVDIIRNDRAFRRDLKTLHATKSNGTLVTYVHGVYRFKSTSYADAKGRVVDAYPGHNYLIAEIQKENEVLE